MAERRHRPALDHLHAGRALGPNAQALERKLRPPAQPARHGRKPFLESAPQTGLGADVIYENDLAAGPGDARELIERGFGIRDGRDHVLRDHHVEEAVGEAEPLRVHDCERVHIGKSVLGNAPLGLAQHRLGDIDADQPIGAAVVGQRNAGADADFENAPANPFGRRDRRLTAMFEHASEHEVVDRRPPRIGPRDRVPIEFRVHPCAPRTANVQPRAAAAA